MKIADFGPFFKKIWMHILPTNNALKKLVERMGIFFRIMCKKNHDCRSFFDRDIKFQSIYFKIEQNSSEIYNCENNHLK
jgi:hypothetical protein